MLSWRVIVARIISAGVSCVTAWWAYKVGSVLFARDDTFSGGDPFALVLLPVFLVFLVLLLGLLAVLVFTSMISAAYAFHPPLAAWILGTRKNPSEST